MESRSIIPAKEAKYNQQLKHEPPDVYLEDHIMDIQFSPVANVLAASQVTGNVRIFTYNEKKTKEHVNLSYHSESCRQVKFSPDGNILYTGSSDGSIGVVSNGVLEGQLLNAHSSPINSIAHIENGYIVATGDDDGLIKIWDLRVAGQNNLKQACVMKFQEHEGTISDMKFAQNHNMLVSASGDGHLGVFDLKKGELYAMSDNFEEDLTALVICKYGKKVLASSSEGVVNIFSWDWFGDCNDRIVGHPNSIDTMITYDEDTIITGSEDGLIRAVSVLPNKIIAILSDPTDQDEDVFHIQRVALSHDKMFLASCSLDDIIKIIDVSHLNNRLKEEFDFEGYEKDIQENPRVKRKKRSKKNKAAGDEDMQDDEEKKDGDESSDSENWEDDSSDDDSDDSDDSDMSMEQDKHEKKDKKLNPKNNSIKKSQNMIDQEKRKQFFSDL
ncbi:wd repeat-containing protein 55 [Stylonychia lemnae]|uniref:Wd repeat-containing protein 55 n=1 Tax=Stylonychia lemnae TaxID=5949 RepID=A0A077ZU06_STYLE|nr:wd repeat-containing protein 55 [Stylonychia lemnae]|eukprot:CDW71936.1 wd repeat-containing protein 55 [Stylonychia lemnae]